MATARCDHDWLIIPDPFARSENPNTYLERCPHCGMIQRCYPANWDFARHVHLHQQGWNLREGKPYVDVPNSAKGWAG